MTKKQNKSNYKIAFCLSVLCLFFSSGIGYAGPQSVGVTNPYESLLGPNDIDESAQSEGGFNRNGLGDLSNDDGEKEGVGSMKHQPDQGASAKNSHDAHAENDWGSYLRNLLPTAPSWDTVEHSAKWVKANSWDKLPSLDEVKQSAEKIHKSAQPALSYAYDTAGSALNKLSSGAESAWSYLFGGNNEHRHDNAENHNENDVNEQNKEQPKNPVANVSEKKGNKQPKNPVANVSEKTDENSRSQLHPGLRNQERVNYKE